MEPAAAPLAGSDQEAFERLCEITSEVADVLALHAGMKSPATAAAVDKAVAELPLFEGRVVELHYKENKSFRSIAAELACAPSKAYRAHGRALATLRRKLGE